MEIRQLVDYREQLVRERTQVQNRLRTHLVTIDPELEASIPSRSLDLASWQTKIRRRLARLGQTTRVRIGREQINRIIELTRQVKEIERELDHLTALHNPQLRTESGCGPITAGILIGQTAGAQRFATDAKFARQAGAGPIPASSGKTSRFRVHPGGNRQLNRALHIIALVRARTDPRHHRLPRPKARRRQDLARSDPLPQTPPRPTHLAHPLRARAIPHDHDHRRPRAHALHHLKTRY